MGANRNRGYGEKRIQMAKKLVLTAITGPRACGKSTLITTLKIILGKQAIFGDMSGILDWYAQQEVGAGKMSTVVTAGTRETGGYIPDDLVREAFFHWLNSHTECPGSPNHIVCGGLPRTTEQLNILRGFDNARIIHQSINKDASQEKMLARQTAGEGRADASLAAFEKSWRMYERFTLPAVKSTGEMALNLFRDQPLLIRVQEMVRHMPIDQVKKRELLDQLNNSRSLVRQFIGKVESGQLATLTSQEDWIRSHDGNSPSGSNPKNKPVTIPNAEIFTGNMRLRGYQPQTTNHLKGAKLLAPARRP